jgi:hypothetical protein
MDPNISTTLDQMTFRTRKSRNVDFIMIKIKRSSNQLQIVWKNPNKFQRKLQETT